MPIIYHEIGGFLMEISCQAVINSRKRAIFVCCTPMTKNSSGILEMNWFTTSGCHIKLVSFQGATEVLETLRQTLCLSVNERVILMPLVSSDKIIAYGG